MVRFVLLKLTTEPLMKLVPFTVSVCDAAPAVTELGDRLVMVGTGLGVGAAVVKVTSGP